MAIQTTGARNSLAARYGADAVTAALYTTAPGSTVGIEPGTPYARRPLTWGTPANGSVTASATFDIPAGTTVVGAGVHGSDGAYLDGGAVTQQTFSVPGSYVLTLTFTES
jgi:hypothetical protein